MKTTTKAAKDLVKGDVVIVNGAECAVWYDSAESIINDGTVCVYIKGLLTNDSGVFVLEHMEFTVKVVTPEDRLRKEAKARGLNEDAAVFAATAAGLL